jgi:hypothetical protein
LDSIAGWFDCGVALGLVVGWLVGDHLMELRCGVAGITVNKLLCNPYPTEK